ncbi:Ribokinase [Phlyctema vagabunda]|uniref:Ribokinase n=1 Tax=Phlyctema vagabunda TaxID=108571 RepID=A0ABR4PG90_9HELO
MGQQIDNADQVLSKARILVIGSLNLDFILTVQHHPASSDHVRANSEQRIPGGHGANQAVACARLSRNSSTDDGSSFGITVALEGAVGELDDFGDQICTMLTENWVDVSGVRRIPKTSTGYAHVNVDSSGGSRVTYLPAANDAVLPSMFPSLPSPKPDILLLQLEIPLTTVEYLVKLAHNDGVEVLLNAAPVEDDSHLPGCVYPLVDHIIVNEIHADTLTGIRKVPFSDRVNQAYMIYQHYLEACDHFHELGVRNVVITLGELGAVASCLDPDSQRHRRYCFDGAVTEDGVRDTTGGSDTFIGAYAVEIVRQRQLGQDQDIGKAVEWGIKAAGICVAYIGSSPGIPWRDQVAKLTYRNSSS